MIKDLLIIHLSHNLFIPKTSKKSPMIFLIILLTNGGENITATTNL